MAYKCCLLGATSEDLADVFEVSRNTIGNWLARYPEFRKAAQDGRDVADGDVAHALLQKAKGFTHKDVKILQIDGGAEQVEYDRYAQCPVPLISIRRSIFAIDADAMQANMDATDGAVLAERATFLLAEKMGKQGLHRGAGPAREGTFRRGCAAGLLASFTKRHRDKSNASHHRVAWSTQRHCHGSLRPKRRQVAPSQASAPTTSASTPVSMVGCRTGANCGL